MELSVHQCGRANETGPVTTVCGVGVGDGEGVAVGAGVGVAVGTTVAVGVGTGVMVGTGEGVDVGGGAGVTVGREVGVAVGRGVGVGRSAVGDGAVVDVAVGAGRPGKVVAVARACPPHATAESTSAATTTAMSLPLAMARPLGSAWYSVRREGRGVLTADPTRFAILANRTAESGIIGASSAGSGVRSIAPRHTAHHRERRYP